MEIFSFLLFFLPRESASGVLRFPVTFGPRPELNLALPQAANDSNSLNSLVYHTVNRNIPTSPKERSQSLWATPLPHQLC